MESVQISPCGCICERKESWKEDLFGTSATKTVILTFSKIKCFLQEQITSEYLST